MAAVVAAPFNAFEARCRKQLGHGRRLIEGHLEREHAARMAEVAKALGDPIRLQLVDVLRKHAGKVCVCELVPLFDISQPTLSHHLKKLREAERYQLNIAEKYYRAADYKVAMTEYEKFLRLYEKSEGAAYAQLKWSLCLVQRRQQNTAIRDGFQSIMDYWPDSPEAIASWAISSKISSRIRIKSS